MSFNMDDYNDVPSRIAEFRSKHPDGVLQQVALDFREVNGSWWVIYTAAAFRTADDARPGHGTAWEPVPGKTAFTRDSELQNAETAAWGRAIVAALAADTKKGIATREEVQNRRTESPADIARNAIRGYCQLHDMDLAEVATTFYDIHQGALKDDTNPSRLWDYLHSLMGKQVFSGPPPQDEEQK